MSKATKYEKKKIKDVFQWFWEFTSFGGFTQSRESDNLISKWAWFILALLGYGITLYQCYQTILTFFDGEFNTKITFITGTAYETDIKFPAITVCNSNRVHCGHLYESIVNCTQVWLTSQMTSTKFDKLILYLSKTDIYVCNMLI